MLYRRVETVQTRRLVSECICCKEQVGSWGRIKIKIKKHDLGGVVEYWVKDWVWGKDEFECLMGRIREDRK